MTMSAHPALVLNADFRPMSYFPLSLLCWEDAVLAVFSGRVSVVAEYDTWVRSPSTADPAAVCGGAAQVPALRAARCVHALQRVPARPLHLPVLRRGVSIFGADVRARRSALARRTQTTWSNIVTACVPCNTGKGNSLRIKPRRPPREPTPSELLAAKRTFPPDHLHESWTDYLYWDVELEA